MASGFPEITPLEIPNKSMIDNSQGKFGSKIRTGTKGKWNCEFSCHSVCRMPGQVSPPSPPSPLPSVYKADFLQGW